MISFNLHRPQRSSVIRSKHDLQKVCWQGNCNGSRKISRQIGLKKSVRLESFEITFFY
jgi:hypothetical protein